MDELIQKFIQYVTNEKRMSKHTIVSYQSDLNQFQNFLIEQLEVESIKEITHNEIRTWLAYLKDSGISNRTINRKISTLKSFYNYLKKIERVEVNPMLKIISPKIEKKLPVYFNNNSLEKLFVFFENQPRDFNIVRDHLIIEMLYSTGIRLAELIEIKHTDVLKNEIKVLGKRNKERLVTKTSSLASLIEEYETLKSKLNPKEQNYLIINDSGNKLYPKFVYRVVNNYISLVTSERKKSPHTLRHSFATNLLNEGTKLHVIKEALGHSNLKATEVYTHNSIARLKEAYKKFHPKENSNN